MSRARSRNAACVCAILLALAPAAARLWAAETEIQYLSGKGKDDMVKWDFMCNNGMKANVWSTIGVPSNWELQGFGIYSYGGSARGAKVQGHYKRTFTTPANWAADKKDVFIVFEGVMTDTQVSVNGQSAGPMHQGGYYQFKYDITKLLKAGDNLLEVTVDDDSANASINAAERRGDYWNYAGIYRPVYLEAVPQAHIKRVAIDARADGTLNVNVVTNEFPTSRLPVITAQVFDAQGQKVGTSFTNASATKIPNPKLWTAETPNLYQLQVTLDNGPGQTHTVTQKFGFRTLEVRAGAGLFLNGSRIMLKGADRHVFWPDSGRCMSEKLSRDDIALMKEMNMNAVRCSHYPPDQHFLDACDEMGLYVLDELAGWQHPYDTPTATRLVQEMVTRDVNHPSILFWDNGNEGGWNAAVDGEFAKWDPQNRHVLHPQQTIRGIDNTHYPQYNAVVTKCAGNLPFFPTEMLHGLYDGGAGAGLEDYWKVMSASKVSAGGFIWALLDEDVVRTDKGGKLDSNGNAAPDGIVGPYREKEGSFYTIKEIWSPIVFGGSTVVAVGQTATVTVRIENHYDFIDAKQCTFAWEARKFHRPNDTAAGYDVVAKGPGVISTSPTMVNSTDLNVFTPNMVASIPPHKSGTISLQNVPSTIITAPDNALFVRAFGPDGRELSTWCVPSFKLEDYRSLTTVPVTVKAAAAETPGALTATAGDLSLQFDKKTGLLAAASRAGKTFSLLNGPRFVAGTPSAAAGRGATAPAPQPIPASTLTGFTQKADGNDALLSATFTGPMKSITYRLRPNGWLTIDYTCNLTGPHDYFGVGFDYPEAKVQGMRYLGNGPAPVYQNRLAGGTLDVWDKKYNNTMVGDPDDLPAGQHYDYPVFKGYYAGVRWLQLNTAEGPITALVNQDDPLQPLFVQVFKPKTPPAGQVGQTGVPFPNAGLSFLHAIPAIGCKFTGATTTGPMGQPAVAKGDYKGSVSLYFGELH